MTANLSFLPAALFNAAAAFAAAMWAAVAPRQRAPVPGAGELAGMSDRELTDLGIGRSEVPHLLDEASRASRSCGWRF
jgi:uncharacterized protein YjiS (DUF1127 family)